MAAPRKPTTFTGNSPLAPLMAQFIQETRACGRRIIALEQGGSEVKLADGEPISNTQGAVDIWSLISQAMFDKSSTGQPSEPQAQ